MCGIVGYIGSRNAADVLIDGLRRLEYRGYDSAGIAAQNGAGIHIEKRVGRIDALAEALRARPLFGTAGIAHTRWATHGAPTDANAHPHTDCAGRISVVHNGIVENFQELKRELAQAGHRFRSETDSEVLAHLIEEAWGRTGDPLEAVRAALGRVRGSYAVAVLFEAHPGLLIAARRESPLVVGLGDGEYLVASDAPAVVPHTREILVLDDGELARIDRTGVRLFDMRGNEVEKRPLRVDWDPEEAEKGGFEHFMIKEIHEQPAALRRALAGRIAPEENGAGSPAALRVDLAEAGWSAEAIRAFRKVYFVACGTAHHAGLVGKRLLEAATDLDVAAELASEFRYGEPRVGPAALVIAVSQSGETADTLAAVKEAKLRGARVLAVTNVVGSSLARAADYVLYTHAGPEIAVASTKAYLTQLACLGLVALYVGRVRGTLSKERERELAAALERLPALVEQVIRAVEPKARELARRWQDARDLFYIGRGLDYAVAREGQLKVKEIAYVHAEALAAGELKHGTLALIEEGVPVVALATQRPLVDKTLSNIQEVAARGGDVVALALEDCPRREALEETAREVWYLPAVPAELAPVLAAVPLQLFAYHMAKARGLDVDKPRNLAKSVTVE